MGTKFTAVAILVDKKGLYKTINIYGPDLIKEKEIIRLEHEIQAGKGVKVFHGTLSAAVSDNKIFLAGKEDFVIHIYDENGEKFR
ncbi:hypothetical protein ACFLRB_02400, partial [Acidobacteriota bacterium]